mmetsp:Transcript_23086/g.33912  ORF Transcript_23086/g.33912 Transcript_23086/m.33912 type:complete len:550 (-) Transcript_23086:970-2619(-)
MDLNASDDSPRSFKKIIYFVRHAEAVHNVKEREAVQEAIARGETDKSQQDEARRAVLRGDESLRDAPLSEHGIHQVSTSFESLAALTSSKIPRPEVVLVSPLRRTLMTATELFGGKNANNEEGSQCRFTAIEMLREKRTGLSCDERSDLETIRAEFPHVDLSGLDGTDIPPIGEDNIAVRARTAKFLDEKLPHIEGNYLAIVSHKGWLREFRKTLKSRVDEGRIRVDFDLDKWDTTLYDNAEVRVVAMRWQDGELTSVVSRSVTNALSMVDDGFQYSLGPPSSGFSMFLAHRTTKVHFIVHAEGHHNVAARNSGCNGCLLRGNAPAIDHPLYDASLTSTGVKQAEILRNVLATRPSGSRSFTAFDLVVVSPLTRALETAQLIFGRDPGLAPIGSPERAAGLPIRAPQLLVREECRERYGHFVCNGRQPVSQLEENFPAFDFSEVLDENDVLHGDEIESASHCRDRAARFLEWLSCRPEGCVAVVTHGSFLRHLFGQFGDELQEEDRESLHREAHNCELRSVVICSHKKEQTKQRMMRHRSTLRVPSTNR